MRLAYSFISLLFLVFFINGSEYFKQKELKNDYISGKITLNLKNAVWRLLEEKPIYQNIFIDLICKKGKCEQEVYGWSPKYNQDIDHQGIVTINRDKNAWQAQVSLNIRSSPFQMKSEQAEYNIEIVPYKKNLLIGSYTGNLNGRFLQGKVTGIVTPNQVKNISNHQVIKPQEHPRLVFRKSDLEQLREKAKTDYGKAILNNLNQSLQGKIYYDGYAPNGGFHAAGHCFLALLNNDNQVAQKAWEISQKTIDNSPSRRLELSQIVTGISLAYDLCYPLWNQDQRKELTKWLANQSIKLITGGGKNWNGGTVSNWNARARSAGGLALLAIMNEPAEFFPDNQYWESPNNFSLFLNTALRNIQRYLDLAIGDAGFGTEGDLYTRESAGSIIPFLHAYQEVLGQDLISESHAAWFLPNAVMRMVKQGDGVYIPPYGRHRVGAKGSLFAIGLATLPEQFLPAVFWFFDDYFGFPGNETFGVGKHTPHDAIYALVGYQEDTERKNPTEVLGKNLVDRQKGFYVFRNQWQSQDDFVSSIYLKQQPRVGGWSFPEVGSFRITGLGTNWAIAGIGDGKPESENIVNLPQAKPWETAQPISFFKSENGSGIITMKTKEISIPKSNPPLAISNLRSFAVDYSKSSGVPALFAIVDIFSGANSHQYFQAKNWTMHTEGQVTIEGRKFTIKNQSGETLQGIFVTPKEVKITVEKNKQGNTIIATGGDQFFVVMTIQKKNAPPIKITGDFNLDSRVDVGNQTIRFLNNRLVLEQF